MPRHAPGRFGRRRLHSDGDNPICLLYATKRKIKSERVARTNRDETHRRSRLPTSLDRVRVERSQ
jgi:hypothetical protein